MTNPEFKWKHFAPEIILWCLRWYGSTPMSYANLSDMLQERGISVNRSTIYRWFIEYAPALRKKLRRRQFIRADSLRQLDETYVKVKRKWHYLYRAINKQGETLDFYFSRKRNKDAAYQFLKRCLRYYDVYTQPNTLNTDKHSSYANAIARQKKEGRLRADVEQRQVKYLNNGIEYDHVSIKKLVVGTGGFKIRKRAWPTLQGFESLRMLNKGQFDFWLRRDERKVLVRERTAFMNRLFNVEVVFNKKWTTEWLNSHLNIFSTSPFMYQNRGKFGNSTTNCYMIHAPLDFFNLAMTEFVSEVIAKGFENNFRREVAAFKRYNSVCGLKIERISTYNTKLCDKTI